MVKDSCEGNVEGVLVAVAVIVIIMEVDVVTLGGDWFEQPLELLYM